jgi:hypothetical protein
VPLPCRFGWHGSCKMERDRACSTRLQMTASTKRQPEQGPVMDRRGGSWMHVEDGRRTFESGIERPARRKRIGERINSRSRYYNLLQ